MSRMVPPPTAVITPRMIAAAGASPYSRDFCAPATQKNASPTASSTMIGRSSSRDGRATKNAMSAPAVETARYGQRWNAAGGTAPMSTSRTRPPPIAVTIPSASTPTMSSRTARTAVKAPFSAKAKVPRRSRARSRSAVDTPPLCRTQEDDAAARRTPRLPQGRGCEGAPFFRSSSGRGS